MNYDLLASLLCSVPKDIFSPETYNRYQISRWKDTVEKFKACHNAQGNCFFLPTSSSLPAFSYRHHSISKKTMQSDTETQTMQITGATGTHRSGNLIKVRIKI